jgi:hypothetical protein
MMEGLDFLAEEEGGAAWAAEEVWGDWEGAVNDVALEEEDEGKGQEL